MTVDVQAVIQALIKANETPRADMAGPRKPVITISRDHGTGGHIVAERLAEKLDVLVYDKQVLEAVAKHADVDHKLMETLHEQVSTASDAWLYAMVFGKNVTRDDYKRALVTAVRAIYRTGGIVVGRGGHVILQGRDVLRVRITGTVDACARRIAHQEHIELSEAKTHVRERNAKRGKYVWDMFRSRLNDPTNFDVTINTDHFPEYDQVVEIILGATKALRLDQPVVGTTNK